MLPNGRPLGAHLPLGDGMVKAADRAAAIGISALQVFSDNPTSWRRRPTLPRELPAFRDRLAGHGIAPLSIHAPYLVNLAGPADDVFERSVGVLANELGVAQAYGAAYVNVHIGSHRGAGVDAGIARLGEGIAAVHELVAEETPGVLLVLENGAGGGFGIGSTVEELAGIDRAVVAAGVSRDRFAYCIDTAHAWGAGYAIGTEAGVDDLMARLDGELGLDRVRMVHLNDSRSAMGSRMDRHEHIGAGRIGIAGLRRMVTHPALEHVAYYLETPGMEEGWDAVNVARVVALVDGRSLEPLPAAAFATRSARGRSAPVEGAEAVSDDAVEDDLAAEGQATETAV
jgi:deoxyribonuclease-4